MTAQLPGASQIERLRAWAREFADAVERIAVETATWSPFRDESWARAFWTVLVTLVVDEVSYPLDLTEDMVLATYAVECAIGFYEEEAGLE